MQTAGMNHVFTPRLSCNDLNPVSLPGLLPVPMFLLCGDSAASATISYDTYTDYAVEDSTPQLDYKGVYEQRVLHVFTRPGSVCVESHADLLLFTNRSSLVSFSTSDQRGGDLPLPSRSRVQEHAGHPLRDELRPRVPTAGQELHSLPRQPPVVRDRVLPQSVGGNILRGSVWIHLVTFKSHEKLT